MFLLGKAAEVVLVLSRPAGCSKSEWWNGLVQLWHEQSCHNISPVPLYSLCVLSLPVYLLRLCAESVWCSYPLLVDSRRTCWSCKGVVKEGQSPARKWAGCGRS